MSREDSIWPHSPTHQLAESGTFIVTAGTIYKRHFFNTEKKLKALHGGLLKYAAKYRWNLEAWAVFSNHYHFIGHSPDEQNGGAKTLSKFLSHFHSRCASWLNELDDESGRSVFYNYWDTRLTHQRSYLSRLKYVHQNAVKHGLVAKASLYPWCSAGWFERTATSAQVKTIYSFQTDRVKVKDEFEPVWGDQNTP